MRSTIFSSSLILSISLFGSSALAFQGATQGAPAANDNSAKQTSKQDAKQTAKQDAKQTAKQQGQGGQGQGGQGQGGQGQGGQGGGRGQGGFGFGGGGGGQGGGQGGGGGRGMGAFNQLMNRYKADFLRRDIPLFKEQLRFDEGQMAIVETLLNDYDLAFNPAAEASQQKIQEAGMRMFQSFMGGDMREKMRTMRDTIQQDVQQMEVENGGPLTDEARQKFFSERMTKMGEEMAAERKATGADLETKAIMEEIVAEINRWSAEKAEFKKVVIGGIEATLGDNQAANWAKFQRFLRREKSMDNAILSGEATNLFVVMDEAGVSQTSIDGSAKTLDDYELQLDNALVSRDSYIDQSEPKMMRVVLDGDIAAAKAIAERQITLRKAVREVNDQFRTMIVGAMPAEDGAKFNQAALAAAFRRVYRQTRTTEMFTKALELTDLSPEARTAVSALQVTYIGELAGMNERVVTATRKEEPQQRLEESERMIGMMSGSVSPMAMMGRQFGQNNAADPVGKLMDERGVMGTRYMDQLKALLTPAQQELMPKGRDGGRNAGAFGTGKISDLPEQFQEAAKKADKNKDGTIDEDERTELFRGMRGGQGGGGQGGGGQGGGGRGGQGGQNGQGGNTN